MNHKNLNNKVKDYNYYINIASKQKVDLSKEQVKELLISKTAINDSAWFSRYASTMGSKSVLFISLLLVSSLLYFVIKSDSNLKLTNTISQKSKNEIVSENRNFNLTYNYEVSNKAELPKQSNGTINEKRSFVKIKTNSSDIKQVEFSNSRVTESVSEKKELSPLTNDDNTSNQIDKTLVVELPRTLSKVNTFVEDKINQKQMGIISLDLIKMDSYWVAFANKFTPIDNRLSVLTGGMIGWAVNENITLGLSGYGSSLSPNVKEFDKTNSELYGNSNIGYGTVFFEYVVNPNSLVHFSINSSFGFGAYSVKDNNANQTTKPFAIVEPGATVEVNLNSFSKVGLGVSYRFSEDLSGYLNNINSNFNSILGNNYSVCLLIKIGKF